MQIRLKRILIQAHFVSLAIAVINILAMNFTAYSLESDLRFTINLFAIVSGFVLFFFYLKPFKKISIYFSTYVLAPLFLIVALVIRGMLGMLIFYIILFPLTRNVEHYERNGFTVITPSYGLMAPCCAYQLKEQKFWIFDKYHGIFETQGEINFETMRFKSGEDLVELSFSVQDGTTITERIKLNE